MRWLVLLLALLAACTPPAAGPDRLQVAAPQHLTRVPLAWEGIAAAPAGTGGAAAPVSLTASDGTGLRLVSLAARAAVEGPLAFTELHLVFENPERRRIEGTFEITLPSGAAVSRFAMKLPGGFQEGEVVERTLARRAYEDFLHRRVDPALLEQQAGNRFRARVFPIEPAERKQIILSYSEELPSARDPYRLQLRGLPEMEALDIELVVPFAGQSLVVQKQRFAPDRDFVVPLDKLAHASPGALRHGRFAVARVASIPSLVASEPLGGLVVLFDTSASRALDFPAQVERLGAIVHAIRDLAPTTPLQIACFDQEVSEIFQGEVSRFGEAELARIRERGALGASDLAQALRWVAGAKPPAGSPARRRVLLISDGVATAGDTGGRIRDAAARLRDAGVVRLDAVAAGGLRDQALLDELAGALPRPGVAYDAALPPARLVEKLTREARSIRVDVPGAAWFWPRVIDGVQALDEALVYAEIPEGRPFEIVLGGEHRRTDAAPAAGPLLERACAEARIRGLLAAWDAAPANNPERDALRRQVVDLSTRSRVLSPFTALLVLETEADYARYRIDRRALTDILVVGDRGVERAQRRDLVAGGGSASGQSGPDAQWPRTTPAPRAPAGADTDRDGILDAEDRCPTEPETFNAREDDDGCPDRSLIILQESSIIILDKIYFAEGSAVIRPESMPILEAIAQVMKQNPQIELVEVGGHTDSAGADAANQRVSEERANVVRERLIQLGVDAARLVAKGYGEARPIEANTTAEGRAKNRRIEFLILRAASSGWQRSKRVTKYAGDPLDGKLRDVMALLAAQRREEALRAAEAWRAASPGDALALIAVGEAREALGAPGAAARAYGSLVDLYPGHAEMRRHAGERLDRVAAASPGALALAIDTYRKALEDRPDHPSGHHLLASALLRAGQPEAAFEALAAASARHFSPDRFPGAHRILRDDLGLAAAAWARAAPHARQAIADRTRALGAAIPTAPSLRFVLTWQTDVGDVDLHVEDGKGRPASYAQPRLPDAGELYADVTTGYGPEVLAIEGAPPAYPYKLKVHVATRGPTGYVLGKVEIVEHDGAGGLAFDERPFVIMNDGATADLGAVAGPLARAALRAAGAP